MRAPLKTALASWAPSLKIIIIIIIIILYICQHITGHDVILLKDYIPGPGCLKGG